MSTPTHTSRCNSPTLSTVNFTSSIGNRGHLDREGRNLALTRPQSTSALSSLTSAFSLGRSQSSTIGLENTGRSGIRIPFAGRSVDTLGSTSSQTAGSSRARQSIIVQEDGGEWVSYASAPSAQTPLLSSRRPSPLFLTKEPVTELAEVTEEKEEVQAEGEDPEEPATPFECNICLDMASEPVITLCGHLFCWPCIHQWMSLRSRASNTCPVCKAGLSQEKLIPVYTRGRQSGRDPSFTAPKRPGAQRPEPAPLPLGRPDGFGADIMFNIGFGVFGMGFQFPPMHPEPWVPANGNVNNDRAFVIRGMLLKFSTSGAWRG